ncbi:MAG: GdmH transporter [Amycolatopsis sp.]|nr:GdmH transporter [Amycolatopsis sp.]
MRSTGGVFARGCDPLTARNRRHFLSSVEGPRPIKIVSHSLHAEKARAYLWRQRPDLAARLTRARDYRLGEWILVKPALTVLRLWKLRRITDSQSHGDAP